jgi:hypothetical protein
MPPKKAQSESKQGLVITLVFFILMTLGLGVATYYGFADQEKSAKDVKDAKDQKKVFQDERDFYRAQANFYRAMMGYPLQPDFTADELAQAKDQIDKGSLGKGVKSQEDAKKLIGDLSNDKDLGWDVAGKKAKMTWKDQLAKARADYEGLLKRTADLEAQKKAADKKAKDADDERETAKKTYETELKNVEKKLQAAQGNDRKTIEDLRGEIAKLSADKEKWVEAKEKEVKAAQKLASDKDKEIRKYKELLRQRDEQVAELSRGKNTEVPAAAIRTDWKIVRIDDRGTRVYINLGSADQVQRQLTFSIHGRGLDGRPNPTAKGTMEVVNVLEDHLSQARITSVNDPDRDPVLVGDYLYNPLWNPTLKKHVAVAGLVDLSGGARDPASGMLDFLRSLERQNVVVDAWMDPREDFKIKGRGISISTDYLILAENLESFTDGRGQAVDFGKKVDDGIKKMKEQAASSHVQVIGLRKYLDMIGYRLPPHLQEPTGLSPLYKPRPDLLERPPVERPPALKPAEKK